MELDGRRILICNCERTLDLDGAALARALGTERPEIATQLCRAEIDRVRTAVRSDRPTLVCCTQEAPVFAEVAREEAGADGDPALDFVNIRERAAWSADRAAATPKIAALIAEAAVAVPPVPEVTLRSDGACLVYGTDEVALAAARQLAPRLAVTVVLDRPRAVLPPSVGEVPLFRGTVTKLRGHLGAFVVDVDGYAPAVVSSRGTLAFGAPRDVTGVRFDLILDLTRGTPLVPAPDKRDGYLRVDPGDPAAVQRALFELTGLVGTFGKPRYVALAPELCAHARNRITGCTRCLDVCPASAIRPDGDVVAIDPYLCGGCGSCHSVCPTGAAAYQMPPTEALLSRLRTLLTSYADAGGRPPLLLIHGSGRHAEPLDLCARTGRGLPAHVLPFAVNEATQVGPDVVATALAFGAARVVVLVPPARRGELDGLTAHCELIDAVTAGLGYGERRLSLLIEDDPEQIARAVADRAVPAPVGVPSRCLPPPERRAAARRALVALHAQAPQPVDRVALPAGAPYGTVEVEVEGCTLCLSCVGACPTQALRDSPEAPRLSFVEANCIQCGLCVRTCPEKVMTLSPRLDFTAAAERPRLIKEEEPFACIRCGKLFGVKSSIEKVVRALAGSNPMFRKPGAIDRLKMCETCRVVVQVEEDPAPLAAGPRPRPRTTDDELRARDLPSHRRP